MVQMPNLSPSAIIGMVRVTFMVLCGRRPAIGSFDTSPQGLWQAIAGSFIFTILVTIYPALEATPGLFISAIIIQFVGILLSPVIQMLFRREIWKNGSTIHLAVFCGMVNCLVEAPQT